MSMLMNKTRPSPWIGMPYFVPPDSAVRPTGWHLFNKTTPIDLLDKALLPGEYGCPPNPENTRWMPMRGDRFWLLGIFTWRILEVGGVGGDIVIVKPARRLALNIVRKLGIRIPVEKDCLRLISHDQVKPGQRFYCTDKCILKWWTVDPTEIGPFDGKYDDGSGAASSSHIRDKCCILSSHPDCPPDTGTVKPNLSHSEQLKRALDKLDARGPLFPEGMRIRDLIDDPNEFFGETSTQFEKPKKFVSKCWQHPDGPCACKLED